MWRNFCHQLVRVWQLHVFIKFINYVLLMYYNLEPPSLGYLCTLWAIMLTTSILFTSLNFIARDAALQGIFA